MSVFMLSSEAKCVYEQRQTGRHWIWLILPDEGKGGRVNVTFHYLFFYDLCVCWKFSVKSFKSKSKSNLTPE